MPTYEHAQTRLKGVKMKVLNFTFPGVFTTAIFALTVLVSPLAFASKNLSPGFAGLDRDASVIVMSPDIELFSISGGGVLEPKADWTSAAFRYVSDSLRSKLAGMALKSQFQSEEQADRFADLSSLHAAVAKSISFHHFGGQKLPTKADKLDWSLGEVTREIQNETGARYGLFLWVRDSYASNERKAAMLAFALLGVGLAGGMQVGYASLVDLNSGKVLWFNQIQRGTGDLRERTAAEESVAALLSNFPTSR